MKKLCVYSIIKNEIDHIEEWYNRVKSADYVYLLDTGSTDGTLEKIKELGIPHSQKIYDYFNFATARNECLSLAKEVANDDSWIFGHFDIDEYLDDNCTSEIKLQWSDDYDQMSLIAHNVGNMATPKIHSANSDLFWDYAVHETIRSRTNRNLSIGIVNSTGYNHYQNLDKSRNYYERLKAALAIEGPRVRYLVYAAWEAFLHNEIAIGVDFAKQAADNILNNKNDEYYQNYSWLAMAYYYMLEDNVAESIKITWLEQLVTFVKQGKLQDYRQLHMNLAQYYNKIGNIKQAEQALLHCLKIVYPLVDNSWLDDISLYEPDRIYTELELFYFYNGRYIEALAYATLARETLGSDLNKNNFQLCLEKVKELL